MRTLMRFLQLLAIVIWVGGIIFFAFVLAPVSFTTLPSVHLAGEVVGASLKLFDWIGLACGGLFLLATAILLAQSPARLRSRYGIQLLLIGLMLIGTAYLQWGILPRMDRDRAQTGGDITLASPTNPARIDFDRLHPRSEHVEEAVLLLGLGVIFLLARADPRPN